ncbi:MAG: exodeoxyribonuclease VII large subunit [Gammaproteobacteria bacterium]
MPARRPDDGPPGDLFERNIYSVSRLNREARDLLENGFPLIWIEAEISNLARPSSGHIYFSLKDEAAQVRCAMFRQNNMRLGFTPRDGQRVLVRARVSLYETRGEFQLLAEQMEEAGEGALRRAFEALKRKLEAEGLFSPAHKQPLPKLPRRVAVVTSSSGAAVRDIIHVLGRRFPAVPVRIYPTAVQGSSAPAEIIAAVQLASRDRDCNVIILARGGGSLEDLMAFNDESVARAIHASSTPIVCGVGHETDFTIADFVADVRAPTPSAAAELAVPDHETWLRRFDELLNRCIHLITDMLGGDMENLRWLGERLMRLHPGRWLKQQAQRLDELERRLLIGRRNASERRRAALTAVEARLLAQTPVHGVRTLGVRSRDLEARLTERVRWLLGEHGHRLDLAVRALQSLNPQATLDRGYAIVTSAVSEEVLTDASSSNPGDLVLARLARGELTAKVLKTKD